MSGSAPTDPGQSARWDNGSEASLRRRICLSRHGILPRCVRGREGGGKRLLIALTLAGLRGVRLYQLRWRIERIRPDAQERWVKLNECQPPAAYGSTRSITERTH